MSRSGFLAKRQFIPEKGYSSRRSNEPIELPETEYYLCEKIIWLRIYVLYSRYVSPVTRLLTQYGMMPFPGQISLGLGSGAVIRQWID